MQKPMTEDLDIIRKSGLTITLLEGDLNIIQALDDEPNDVGGLTAQELKAKFDEGPNKIKKYLNETLAPELLAEAAVEAQRAENEAGRQAAEAVRQTGEQARQAAETDRRQAAEALNAALEASVRETERGVTAAVGSLEARVEAREAALERWEDYDGAADYVPGNKVSFEGSSYVNTAACRGVPPTGALPEDVAAGAAHWLLIAAKGKDGKGSLTPELGDERYLQLAGGIVTGPLFVQPPTEGGHAATRAYADAVRQEALGHIANLQATDAALSAKDAELLNSINYWAGVAQSAQNGVNALQGARVELGTYVGTQTANNSPHPPVQLNFTGTAKMFVIVSQARMANSQSTMTPGVIIGLASLGYAVQIHTVIGDTSYAGNATLEKLTATFGKNYITVHLNQSYFNYAGSPYSYAVIK